MPDFDEGIAETDESAKTQRIVVNAWRSIKEICYLLTEIVKQTIKFESKQEMRFEDLVLKIGDFFMTLFIESKHRGVFEQAYVGFLVICEAFWL